MKKATQQLSVNTVRLDKFLASNGYASRRNIEELLKKKKVTIDGKRVLEPGVRFNPKTSEILIDSKPIQKPSFVYFALNKPKGVVSTASDEMGRKTVVEMIGAKERIYPIGRLDQNTTGLLLLTNDGDLANRLTHPRYHIPKTYELVISGHVHKDKIKNFRNGVQLDDGLTAPAEVEAVAHTNKTTTLHVVLHEGKKRQIRRMCQSLKLSLEELKRIQIGSIKLSDLAEGQFRTLTEEEIITLKQEAGLLEA